MAKKYCSSCAHLNPEWANYYENCGVKLYVREGTPIQTQAALISGSLLLERVDIR